MPVIPVAAVVATPTLIPVKFAPLTAGSVEGNRASGIVPDVSCVAFKAVRFAPPPIKFVAVVVPDTFTFCKNVAFVLVLIFSVEATPVSNAPLPLNDVAVTTPVANISPSTLKVTQLPTLIPSLAVIRPTASTFVTSS